MAENIDPGNRHDSSNDTPPSSDRPPRRRWILLVVVSVIVLIVVGGVGAFVVVPWLQPSPPQDGTPTPTPTPFQFFRLDDPCSVVNGQICRTIFVNTDRTWENTSLLDRAQSLEQLGQSLPGALWLQADNPDRVIRTTFFLPEGDTVDYVGARLTLAALHPVDFLRINGQRVAGRDLNGNESLLVPPDAVESAFSLAPTINLRNLLQPGLNTIEFQFAPQSALPTATPPPTPTQTPTPAADESATPAPIVGQPPVPPQQAVYGLLAQFRVTFTADYGSVITETFATDATWQLAPYAPFHPNSGSVAEGEPFLIQGVDDAGADGVITLERVFYLAEEASSYFLNVFTSNSELQQVNVYDSRGESQSLQLPEPIRENGRNLRYTPIPFAGGLSEGINRLELAYTAETNTAHIVTASLQHNETGDEPVQVFTSDENWLRGEYRIETQFENGELTLDAQLQKGETHVRGYIGIPGVETDAPASGNVRVTCVNAASEIPCDEIDVRFDGVVQTFGDDFTLLLENPTRLFSLDVFFPSDVLGEELASITLQLQYVAADDTDSGEITLGEGSVWYEYRPAPPHPSPSTAWARIDGADFIYDAVDDERGRYDMVFETQIPLPDEAVVVDALLRGSVDDWLTVARINDTTAFSFAGVRPGQEDFRQGATYPIDTALLHGGANRFVLYAANTGGPGALAALLRVSYYVLAP